MRLAQRATTARGEIAWERFGEGPPVVLVHGTPSRAFVWRHVAGALACSHTVYVFDLLGFGESERHVEQDVSLVAHGEVLAELVDQWGLDSPCVAGHDIGGAIVLRAHLLEGVAFSRLALIDAVVLSPWMTDRTRAMRERSFELPDEDLAGEIEEHLRSATHGELPEETFGALFGQWEGAEGQALYLRNIARLDESHTDEFRDRLATMDTPTLVIWGQEDAWLPVDVSERVEAAVPGARRVVLPEAGHFSMEDGPEEIARLLAGFFA